MDTRHLAAAILTLCLAGCAQPQPATPSIRILPPLAPAETPPANLPAEMRPTNWVSARGEGSCANASTVYSLRWHGHERLADEWRRKYAGGEYSTGLLAKYRAEGVAQRHTLTADAGYIDWVSRTRRSSVIWYYPSHAINFVGFSPDGQTAFLCDNNRPQNWIRVPRQEFLRRWDGYGGFGVAPLSPPCPPPLYDAVDRT